MDRTKLYRLILFLEMPPSTIDFIRLGYNQSVRKLEGFKTLLKKQRRVLCKKYHPDKDVNNLERMKCINDVIDNLLKLTIQPPMPRPFQVVFTYGFGDPSQATDNPFHIFNVGS